MSAVKLADERKPFFTVRTLAAYLDCHERTVRNLLAEDLPSYKVAGMRRISADDVDRWLASRRDDPR